MYIYQRDMVPGLPVALSQCPALSVVGDPFPRYTHDDLLHTHTYTRVHTHAHTHSFPSNGSFSWKPLWKEWRRLISVMASPPQPSVTLEEEALGREGLQILSYGPPGSQSCPHITHILGALKKHTHSPTGPTQAPLNQDI